MQKAVDLEPLLVVEPADPKAGTALAGPFGMRLRFVPAGTYTIGSTTSELGHEQTSETQHKVTLSRGFWLTETEITQAQWGQLVLQQPSRFKACGGDCPVEKVNWYDAAEFANRLSDKMGLARCYQLVKCKATAAPGDGFFSCKSAVFAGLDCPGYRLPSEAEWEVAARAGSMTAVYSGDLTRQEPENTLVLGPIAWYGANSGVGYAGGSDCWSPKQKQKSAQRCGPHPVGQKRANAWGFRDMLGNVWEWTGDRYKAYPADLV